VTQTLAESFVLLENRLKLRHSGRHNRLGSAYATVVPPHPYTLHFPTRQTACLRRFCTCIYGWLRLPKSPPFCVVTHTHDLRRLQSRERNQKVTNPIPKHTSSRFPSRMTASSTLCITLDASFLRFKDLYPGARSRWDDRNADQLETGNWSVPRSPDTPRAHAIQPARIDYRSLNSVQCPPP
jgi:hypothetical protein